MVRGLAVHASHRRTARLQTVISTADMKSKCSARMPQCEGQAQSLREQFPPRCETPVPYGGPRARRFFCIVLDPESSGAQHAKKRVCCRLDARDVVEGACKLSRCRDFSVESGGRGQARDSQPSERDTACEACFNMLRAAGTLTLASRCFRYTMLSAATTPKRSKTG